MSEIRFEWDERKRRANEREHGVTFDEAQTVFYDENALLIPDSEHSQDEDRFVILGMSASFRALVVCHCYREGDRVIRIISARRANKSEQATYRRRRTS
ncbi:MAG: BrnT family toxin [Myxococcales bacterium]|jgi:uncharacterized DUF497 family protein|nr:MAG: BrnT family toxin [Myxococcales bacterium]